MENGIATIVLGSSTPHHGNTASSSFVSTPVLVRSSSLSSSSWWWFPAFFFFSRVSSLVYGTRKQRSNLQIYDSHSCYVSLVDSWRRGGTLSTVCSRISFRDPARDGPVNISFVEIALFDRLWIIRGSRWDVWFNFYDDPSCVQSSARSRNAC